MWARIVECMLGIWMLISPFIFRHPTSATAMWACDWIAGACLIVFSLASYWAPTRWGHWWLLLVGTAMLAFGRASASPPLHPGLQNDIFVGICVILIALVPNCASQPPQQWREYCGLKE